MGLGADAGPDLGWGRGGLTRRISSPLPGLGSSLCFPLAFSDFVDGVLIGRETTGLTAVVVILPVSRGRVVGSESMLDTESDLGRIVDSWRLGGLTGRS